MTFRVLVTGANGHLGVRLIQRLVPHHEVTAVVRSESARSALLQSAPGCEVHVLGLDETAALARLMLARDCCVHLVGIIRETRSTNFQAAHIDTTANLLAAAAAASLPHIIYISLLGTDETSRNRCFATRGTAERLFAESTTPTTILRVGMVLGEGDYAVQALRRRAARSLNFTFRASSLEQPIDARDLVESITLHLGATANGTSDVAGPESLTRAQLISRAAIVCGRTTRVLSVPLAVGKAVAWLLEQVMQVPPVSRDMLDVLDHDDALSPTASEAALGTPLTPLDVTLARVLKSTPG